jgi:SAM-dependent methyltransferase
MSASLTPTKALVRAWKGLGAPAEASSALVMGSQGADLARAVRDNLSPGTLLLMHAKPPPARSHFETTPVDLPTLARERPASFDLVAVGDGLESGDLVEVRERLQDIAGLLRPGGVLAAAVEAMAAPDSRRGSYEHLLFPHLARAGELGDEIQARAPLPVSAWRALVHAAGFEIIALDGARGQMLPADFQTMHEARLAAYDERELAGGSLRLIARRTDRSA